MEGNGLSGGLFSGMGSGMLGLEMPLHPQQKQQQQQNPQNPHHLHHQHPQLVPFAFAHNETDHHNPQNQQSVKHNYPYATKPKQQQQQQQLALSDEDEPAGDDGDGKRKVSPWQRMKWTDSMVRLLIMAVYYIGDDQAGSEGNADAAGKKKAGGLLQKKGKWKSVSRAMMEKGFYVSPQQCEDKFNDLNKRYKRVNDILGKGTACQVVENQSLLDSMDNLSPKMKDEVRKLLNSKHLFFREMCAYHNSCGVGGGSGAAGTHQSQEMAAGPSHHHHQQCNHSPDSTAVAPNSGKTETEGSKIVKGGSNDEDDEEDDDDDDEDEYVDDEDEEEEEGLGVRPHNDHQPHHDQGDDDNEDERLSTKRQKKGIPPLQSPLIQQISSDLMSLIQDGSKNPWEKKQWMKTQLMKLEEQRVSYQCEAFELEKQRLKWVKFSSKKEREMERAKLKNQRTKLENEKMLLLLRQRELELIEFQHQQHQQSSNRRGDPSSITG